MDNLKIESYYYTRKSLNKLQEELPNLYEKTKFLDTENIKERMFYYFHNLQEIVVCKTCKINKPKFISLKQGYLDCCSNTCAQSNPDVIRKKEKTCLRNYGVTKPAKSKIVLNKMKQSCIDRYGVDNAFKSNILMEKSKKTCLTKYGTEYHSQSNNFKCKYKLYWGNLTNDTKSKILDSRVNTLLDKYGVDNPMKYGLFIDKQKKNIRNGIYETFKRYKNVVPMFNKDQYNGSGGGHNLYKWKCLKCGGVFEHVIYSGIEPRCYDCFPKNYLNNQTEVEDFITQNNFKTTTNTRKIISPLELDIYIQEKSIAIEYNGLYWHSESRITDKFYHLNKTNLCNEKGIRLIHIFDDEWVNKKQIVKSRLRHILGNVKYSIGARKCVIKVIDNKLKNKFLNKYHIQGQDISSVKLGSFYKNRLVAVMTFSKRRYDNKEGYELVRFCTIANFNIVGAAGKLLKYFERNYNDENKEIISYADRRWSDGGLYKALGFELSHISPPGFFVMKDYTTRENRLKYQKHKLKDILENFDCNLTANQNMINNGYDRIWDCGNYVFKKN